MAVAVDDHGASLKAGAGRFCERRGGRWRGS
jgi:hypothetical protein